MISNKLASRQLIQLSFLMLFVELTIIRWSGANIYALSFFSNFILLASFLGIGIGFIRPISSRNIFPFAPIFFALLILLIYLYSCEYHIQMNVANDDLSFTWPYFKKHLYPVELTLPIVFIATTIVMSSIADGVARVFKTLPPLEAYQLEIVGSLLGISCFSLLAFLNAEPFWWGLMISLLFLSLFIKSWRLTSILSILQLIAICLAMGVFYKQGAATHYQWSPYYKISTQAYSHGRYAVIVNGWPQQFIESVAQRKKYKPFYFMPYHHIPPGVDLNNVLVVGSGTGGDVAIALAEGAKHIDAVEIDPLLYQLGKDLNPNHPYADHRVNIHINDGRYFLHHSKTHYDMIIFALPDSLLVLSGQSSLRLENYLFTLEGINTVYNHLTSNGIFTMYNYYRERWLIDRLANTMLTVFKHAPCFDTEGSYNHWLSVLTISKSPSLLQSASVWAPQEQRYANPATDNHPFIYLKENKLSALYVAALLFIFITVLGSFKIAGISYHAITPYLDLFLMGTAFLLLETKNLITFALLFGSTWFVNALVFVGVLLTVYIAIILTAWIKKRHPFLLYSLLFLSLFLAWNIPIRELLSLTPTLRFLSASILGFSPIFFANLIFADRFRDANDSRQALGANFLGAVLGGLLEYSSLIIGVNGLLLIIVSLYAIAILLTTHFCMPRKAV